MAIPFNVAYAELIVGAGGIQNCMSAAVAMLVEHCRRMETDPMYRAQEQEWARKYAEFDDGPTVALPLHSST